MKKQKQNKTAQSQNPQTAQYPQRLPMTSDLVFRTVLGRDAPECKKALIAVLNLILGREEDPIVDLEYKNPFHLGQYMAGKRTAMDIRVTTSSNETIEIEMQVGKLKHYASRSILYTSQISSESLDSGEGYDKIKKTIHISFVSGHMEAGSDKYHGVYRYLEVSDKTELSDLVELHYLKLDRLPKAPLEDMTPVERFGYYLANAGKDNRQRDIDALVGMGEEAIVLTDAILRKASKEEILRQEELSRKRWEMDQRVQMRASREQGLEQGLKEGIKSLIEICEEFGLPKEEVKGQILEKFGLGEHEAGAYMEQYWR